MDRGAWEATVHGVIKSQTRLSNSAQLNSQHTLNILVSAFICATAFKIPFLCPISHPPPHMTHEGGNPLTIHSDGRENWLVYLSCWSSVLHKPTPSGYVGRRLSLSWVESGTVIKTDPLGNPQSLCGKRNAHALRWLLSPACLLSSPLQWALCVVGRRGVPCRTIWWNQDSGIIECLGLKRERENEKVEAAFLLILSHSLLYIPALRIPIYS